MLSVLLILAINQVFGYLVEFVFLCFESFKTNLIIFYMVYKSVIQFVWLCSYCLMHKTITRLWGEHQCEQLCVLKVSFLWKQDMCRLTICCDSFSDRLSVIGSSAWPPALETLLSVWQNKRKENTYSWQLTHTNPRMTVPRIWIYLFVWTAGKLCSLHYTVRKNITLRTSNVARSELLTGECLRQ